MGEGVGLGQVSQLFNMKNMNNKTLEALLAKIQGNKCYECKGKLYGDRIERRKEREVLVCAFCKTGK